MAESQDNVLGGAAPASENVLSGSPGAGNVLGGGANTQRNVLSGGERYHQPDHYAAENGGSGLGSARGQRIPKTLGDHEIAEHEEFQRDYELREHRLPSGMVLKLYERRATAGGKLEIRGRGQQCQQDQQGAGQENSGEYEGGKAPALF